MAETVAKHEQEAVNEQRQQPVFYIDEEQGTQMSSDTAARKEILHKNFSSRAHKLMVEYEIPTYFENALNGTLHGLAGSALELGTFFYLRNDGTKDAQLAVPLLTPMALAGNKDARFRLGISYMREGQLRNAATWLEKAGEQGSLRALFLAGRCYESLCERGLARLAYNRVSELGNPYGYKEIIRMDGLKKSKFLSLMSKVYTNDVEAQYQLGMEYINRVRDGESAKEQEELRSFGLKWLKSAAAQGHEAARKLYNKNVPQINDKERPKK